MDEVERIRAAYSRRTTDGEVYSLFNPGQLFMSQQLEKDLLRLLDRHGLRPLGSKKFLEVGCGTAWPLRELLKCGATPENLSGIDLLPKAVQEAKSISPNINYEIGNAESLPYEDESFHGVMQFTVFTSILDSRMKSNIAGEMLRVLKPNGVIVWYDYFLRKPTNLDVRAIGRDEIIGLFPNCTFDFNKVTLAPPIARTLAPHSFLLCYFLEKIPWLRTHYLVGIRKKAAR